MTSAAPGVTAAADRQTRCARTHARTRARRRSRAPSCEADGQHAVQQHREGRCRRDGDHPADHDALQRRGVQLVAPLDQRDARDGADEAVRGRHAHAQLRRSQHRERRADLGRIAARERQPRDLLAHRRHHLVAVRPQPDDDARAARHQHPQRHRRSRPDAAVRVNLVQRIKRPDAVAHVVRAVRERHDARRHDHQRRERPLGWRPLRAVAVQLAVGVRLLACVRTCTRRSVATTVRAAAVARVAPVRRRLREHVLSLRHASAHQPTPHHREHGGRHCHTQCRRRRRAEPPLRRP
mmetsp:Transcript_19091/g.67431  ORF Transcript_19091/g.67431 Transcript_19091/m.67431 type:complete len:295 (-) Transcript_19091:641-1525(-)